MYSGQTGDGHAGRDQMAERPGSEREKALRHFNGALGVFGDAGAGVCRHRHRRQLQPEALSGGSFDGDLSSYRGGKSRGCERRRGGAFAGAFAHAAGISDPEGRVGAGVRGNMPHGRKDVQILRAGETKQARAVDIGKDAELLVEYPDGTTESISSGEVSVRGLYGYV